jgi:hypothetical protein
MNVTRIKMTREERAERAAQAYRDRGWDVLADFVEGKYEPSEEEFTAIQKMFQDAHKEK